MHPDYWLSRWENDETGFHQQEVHPYLKTYLPTLGLPDKARIFVPLCGKSRDMAWLREQGFQVLGIELSQLAVEAFFEESGLSPQRSSQAALQQFEAEGVALLCGDFFALTPTDVADCHAIYDRASMIALPPELREKYVAHLKALFPQGATVLLVTLDYEQTEMNGPPFALTDVEVRQFYPEATQRVSRDVLSENPRFQQRGLSRLFENAYQIKL